MTQAHQLKVFSQRKGVRRYTHLCRGEGMRGYSGFSRTAILSVQLSSYLPRGCFCRTYPEYGDHGGERPPGEMGLPLQSSAEPGSGRCMGLCPHTSAGVHGGF